MNDWFRSWHGAPTDPKWLAIAKRAGVAAGMVSAIAWALFDHASQAEPRGSVQGFDPETYAAFSGWKAEKIAAVIAAMTEKGLIVDGALSAWAKRQPKREDGGAERAREWRERNRTQTNAGERERTKPNADEHREEKIREDTEKKGKEEKKEGAQERAPRATRLALDALPDDWRAYCVENHPDLNPEAMWHEFHDYWKACGGGKARKVDWLATWRMWLRRARDFRSGNGRNQGDRPSRGQLLAAEALALGERLDRDSELRERAGPRNE